MLVSVRRANLANFDTDINTVLFDCCLEVLRLLSFNTLGNQILLLVLLNLSDVFLLLETVAEDSEHHVD